MILKVIISLALVAVALSGPVPPVKETSTEDDIVKINADVGGLFEGDIENTNTRNAVYENLLWTPPIAYEFNEQYGWELRNVMTFALNEFSVRTCVPFHPKTDQDDVYVYFTRGSGCSSGVGWDSTNGAKQVTLSVGCEGVSTALHEVTHRIGFWHEQSRPDRDNYVSIQWQNIADSVAYNFDKYTTEKVTTQDIEYDFVSIMHYSDTAFSINSQKTILPAEGHEDVTKIGKGSDFTKLDILKINTRYNCTPMYDNNGYTVWTNWSDCDLSCKQQRVRWCDGSACATWGVKEQEERDCATECAANANKDCDAKFITGSNVLTSPLFPYYYSNNLDCTETIYAPEGETLTLYIVKMDIESYEGTSCPWDYLDIYDGTSTRVLSTCHTNLPEPIKSTGNSIMIHLHTDSSAIRGGYLAYWFPESSELIHMCIFESGSYDSCGWTEVAGSNLTWSYKNGNTPSSSTGPNGDRTIDKFTSTSTSIGHYIFLETSSPATKDQKAQVQTPAFIGTQTGECLKFSYSMYGVSTATFNVYWVPTTGEREILFTASGDHGEGWLDGAVEISANGSEYSIMFEAIRGGSWTGDIAIDEVFLNKGAC